MSRTGPTNVLFEAGEHGDCDEAACMDFLGVDDPERVDVLFVTFTKSARDRIESLKRHADSPPANVGIVSVDVGGSDGSGRIGGESGPAVRRISDPSDLTGVGIAVSEFLSAWQANGNRTVVCFESVTALLQYVDADRVFQFLNELTSKFEGVGARAHFHITPAAHERQVLSVLTSLFDDRVTAAELGHTPRSESATEPASDAPDGSPTDVPETRESAAATADEDDSGFVFAGDTTDTGDDAPGTSDDAGAETEEPDQPATPAAEANASADDSAPPTADEGGEDGALASESDPADIVWSVINGETDEDESPFEFPGDGAAEESDADADTEDDSDVEDGSETDAGEGTEDPTDSGTTDGDADPGTAATANFGRQKRRSERDPIERPRVQRPAEPSDDDGEYKSALFSRTTATVVGVVVMVALVSFLTAAVPMPAGAPLADGDAIDGTPTPEPATEAVVDGTQAQATPSPTVTAQPTATPEPTPRATPDDSGDSGGSSGSTTDSTGSAGGTDGGETTTPEPTATPTPEPTASPTPEPTASPTPEPTATPTPGPTATPTPESSGVVDGTTDVVDDTTDSTTDALDEATGGATDGTTDVVDNTTDSLVGDDGLL